MGGFLYFIPNRPAVSEGDVSRLGLSDVLGGASPPNVGGSGPEGLAGVFCHANGAPESRADGSNYVRHDGAGQTWQKCVSKGGEYWLGYWNDDKPGPKDLARAEGVGGHTVTLDDGSQWVVPLAQVMGGGTAFATKLILDENGDWINGAVEDRYSSICNRAADVFELMLWDDKYGSLAAEAEGAGAGNDEEIPERPEMKIAELYDLAVDALAVNYRIGKYEATALGLLTDHNAGYTMGPNNIIGALIDMPSIVDVVKKNAEVGNTGDGEGA